MSDYSGEDDKKEREEERDGDCFKILPRSSTYCRHELIKPSKVEIETRKGGEDRMSQLMSHNDVEDNIVSPNQSATREKLQYIDKKGP